MSRRFQLQPLDAPLPTVPQGPLSKLPRVDAPRAATRYVEPSPPTMATVGSAMRPPGQRPRPAAPAPSDPAAQPTLAPSAGSATADAQTLYGFNIEELYDYDLPNIRSASSTLTSMIGRTVNPVAAARADARAAKRSAAQATSMNGGSGLGSDEGGADSGADSPAAQQQRESQNQLLMLEDTGHQLKVRLHGAGWSPRGQGRLRSRLDGRRLAGVGAARVVRPRLE